MASSGPGPGPPSARPDAAPGARAGAAPRKGVTTPPGADGGFLPEQPRRPRAESVLVRVVATAGVVAIAVVVGAILGAQDVAAWIMSLVVSLISVTLAAVLWRSRLL